MLSTTSQALTSQRTVEDLIPIAERAAIFGELWGPDWVEDDAADELGATTLKLLDRWKRAISRGEEIRFARRLEWAGLDPESVVRRLGGVRLRRPHAAPSWLEFLRDALHAAAELEDTTIVEMEDRFGFLNADKPVPFEHALCPFVLAAAEELHRRLPNHGALFTDRAHAGMQRGLICHLSEVARDTLAIDFSSYRAIHEGLGPYRAVSFFPGSSQRLYGGFLRKLWRGGWKKLCDDYPMLARLLARGVEQWTEFYADFARHFVEDAGDIAEMLGPAGRIASVEYGLSDRHNGGRVSIQATFESGAQCVYKPKNLDTERAWHRLLAWLNENGASLPFRIFRGVYRPDHGWCEIVPHAPCDSEEQVRRYYVRAGALLCLVYGLEGNDCHAGNLIASGEHPALIDMECLFQHRTAVSIDSDDTAAGLAFEQLWDSVQRTYLLPKWSIGESGESFDISGLGYSEAQGLTTTERVWKDINTDAMHSVDERVLFPGSLATVWKNSEVVRASEYVPAIAEGFRETYRLLMARRDRLFASDGPLAAFRRLAVRYLYRPTRSYADAFKGLIEPSCLRSGAEASIRVEMLIRPFLQRESSPPVWPVVMAEQQMLLDGDIPFFWSNTGSKSILWHGNGECNEFFRMPSFDAVRNRMLAFDEADLERQIDLIYGSFEASTQDAAEAVQSGFASRPGDDNAPLDHLGEAVAIAERIRQSAILSSDGSATWMTTTYYPQAQRWVWGPMGPRFYDGVLGTALFFAALEQVTGGAGFRKLAEGAFTTALNVVDSPDCHIWLLASGIGAGIGGGSILYGLARGAGMLRSERLLDGARRAAAELTRKRLIEDRHLDLMGGAAGCILGLLALHSVEPAADLLDAAVCCGDLLLERREAGIDGYRAWKTLNGALLCGFSHGAAGIGYALCRLAAATGEDRFRDAALEAFHFESSVYREDLRNWPYTKLREDEKPQRLANSWCHGAPGIALGRIGSLCAVSQSDVSKDLERAIDTTQHGLANLTDHLCCGNLGRASILHTAAARLARPDLDRASRSLTHLISSRARTAGRYAVGSERGPFVASLFQGMAGIGYHHLRLARPDALPDVLLWE